MKIFALIMALAWAHEGGHGPKIKDGGKYGGQVVAVIKLGDKHPNVLYKAEFVRSESREVRLYLYDKDMHKADLSSFPDSAEGSLESVWKGKKEYQAFALTKKTDHYLGQAPAPKHRPFHLEAHFKRTDGTYYAGLENQD